MSPSFEVVLLDDWDKAVTIHDVSADQGKRDEKNEKNTKLY